MNAQKYVLQDKYLSVVVAGKPFSLNASHPTFALMKRAIERKQWHRLPKLVTLAEQLASARNGAVTVKNGNVYYHGRAIHTSLTKRIVEMAKQGISVGPMLKFMDNLYQNPVQSTINELYDFLTRYKLPITDDGCFMAYKNVTADYKDNHTRTIDNSVGQVPTMPFKDVDKNRSNACSRGYHFCSLAYLAGFGSNGDHIMGIKVNPKDVVEIPEMACGKGRSWRYEVVLELADRNAISTTTDAPIYLTAVLPVEADRKRLLAKVLAHPTIKRAISKRKLKIKNLRKGTLGRLTKLFAALPSMEAPKPSLLNENPIKVARLQAGLTTTEVAEEMDINSKVVIDAERFSNVGQRKADEFIRAINTVAGRKRAAGIVAPKLPPAQLALLAAGVAEEEPEEGDYLG